MMLEIRGGWIGGTVVADADENQIAFVMFKTGRIFLAEDLIHRRIGVLFVFQFHQQGRMDRTLRNIDQIRVAAARIDFGKQRVVVLRLVEGQLDSVAEGGF